MRGGEASMMLRVRGSRRSFYYHGCDSDWNELMMMVAEISSIFLLTATGTSCGSDWNELMMGI